MSEAISVVMWALFRHVLLGTSVVTTCCICFCFSPDQECQQIFKANFPIDAETIKTKVRQENKKHITLGKRRKVKKETKHANNRTREEKTNLLLVANVG